MLIQLHHRLKNGKTIMQAQAEVTKKLSKKQGKKFFDEIMKSHPLPEGAKWMVCDEKSKYFKWAVIREGAKNGQDS